MKSIGFIGTGVMGGAMAENLMKAGYSLFVHSRTKSRAEPLLRQGAVWCESPAQCAAVLSQYLGLSAAEPPADFTRGLFYRGVD